MNRVIALVYVAAAFSVGCTHAPDPSTGGSLANRAPANTIAPLPTYEQDATLPAWSFDNVPGWLALTTQPESRRKVAWTPSHPNATAVILHAEGWSESVEEGTHFRLVVAEGNLPLTLSEVSRIPYGCDSTPTIMAAFKTPHDLAEELAWITPASFTSASVLAVHARATSSRERVYRIGDLTVRLRVQSDEQGTLTIQRQGAMLFTREFTRPTMEGADVTALDLANDYEIGVPFPQGAFRLDGALSIIVLRYLSFETVQFEVLRVGPTIESAGTQSVYLCAY